MEPRQRRVSSFDAACHEENPVLITYEQVLEARDRIQGHIFKTPLVESRLTRLSDYKLYLKQELLQYTGSFKERGACNAILKMDDDAKAKGVVGASLGNHSQGLAYHGANVILQGDSIAEAKNLAIRYSQDNGQLFINGYDHPDVLAGNGSIGLEILDQLPDVDAILVPVGGGGLLAGILTAVKARNCSCLVYGVETEKVPGMTMSMRNTKITAVNVQATLADGLAISKIGVNAFESAKKYLDKMVVVNEMWLARAILGILECDKVVAEGAGAVGVAAIMQGLVPELKGKKVVCIISGGNIDACNLYRVIDRGLAAENRLFKLQVIIPDCPGGLEELAYHITAMGANIKAIESERSWVKKDIFSVEIKLTLETLGLDHCLTIRTAITAIYTHSSFENIIHEKGNQVDNLSAAPQNQNSSQDDGSHSTTREADQLNPQGKDVNPQGDTK